MVYISTFLCHMRTSMLSCRLRTVRRWCKFYRTQKLEKLSMGNRIKGLNVSTNLVCRQNIIDSGVTSDWKRETKRRIKEIETGKVKGIAVEESLARIRKIAGL